MREFLKRELTIGQCDPASDAFFTVGTRTVVFTLTSDIRTTDQSNARSRKIYSLSGNHSCLFFFNLL